MTETDLQTILLVEDNPSDARLIEEYLKEQSWPAQGVPTLEHVDRLSDAIEARDDDVDIILLDLGLPDSSGVETLDRILEASGDEPVVVLTGLDDEQVGIEAVERGAQDYIVKGDLTPNLLQQTLRYAIERERQQQALEKRNEELELLNRIVRHDIKNDVTVIMGWGDALDAHVDQDGEEHLERIMSASDHITSIAETVGDFLQLLEDDADAELRRIDLTTLLAAEVQKAQSAYENATITVTEDTPEEVHVAATELLSSVFRNLISNAVVHNDKATPTVTIDVQVDDQTVSVRVADNGPGVPDSQKDEIFGRGEMGLQSPGSGIGLYLVDTLVEMYGGEVHIEDRPAPPFDEPPAVDSDVTDRPDGSVFVVTLPRK